MGAATERIPVLVTPTEKRRIAKRAKQAGLSMGAYLRRAATSFREPDDDEVLEGMIRQMVLTTQMASEAIDRALAFVEASNRRIEEMESGEGVAPWA